jgi:hypothetical protein
MNDSLNDIHNVFNGAPVPSQTSYGGLANMPDIDGNYRQPQPLLLIGDDNKIYYRSNLSQINVLAPSQLIATYMSPTTNGYIELSSTWSALLLVVKLRVLSYWYQGTLKNPSTKELQLIEAEELQLNPGRQPIPQVPRIIPERAPVQPLPQWQHPVSATVVLQGLHGNGFLRARAQPAIDIPAPQTSLGCN